MFTISQTQATITITAPGYTETISAPYDIQVNEGGLYIGYNGKHYTCAISAIAQYNAFLPEGYTVPVAAARIANIVKALSSASVTQVGKFSAESEDAFGIVFNDLYVTHRISFEYVESVTLTCLANGCSYNGVAVQPGFSITSPNYGSTGNIVDGSNWQYSVTGKLKAANFKIYSTAWNTATEVETYLVSTLGGAPNVFNYQMVGNDAIFVLENVIDIRNGAFESEDAITGVEDLAATIITTVGYNAFRNCAFETVKLDWVDGVGENCFDNCTTAKTISLRRLRPDGLGGNISATGVFNGVTALENLIVHAIHAKDADITQLLTTSPSCKVSFHYSNIETPLPAPHYT